MRINLKVFLIVFSILFPVIVVLGAYGIIKAYRNTPNFISVEQNTGDKIEITDKKLIKEFIDLLPPKNDGDSYVPLTGNIVMRIKYYNSENILYYGYLYENSDTYLLNMNETYYTGHCENMNRVYEILGVNNE